MSGSFGIAADSYQQAYDNQFSNAESQQTSCAIEQAENAAEQAAKHFLAACGVVAGAKQNAVTLGGDLSEIVQALGGAGAGGVSIVLPLIDKASPVGSALIAALGAVAAGVQVGEDNAIEPQEGITLDRIAAGLAVVGLVLAFAPAIAALADFAATAGLAVAELGELLSFVSLLQNAISIANDLKNSGQNAEQEAAQKNGQGHSDSSGANNAGASACASGHDPLLIDLTGNGLNITPLSASSTYFDFNGNGFSVNTAWAGAGTGFLVIQSSNPAFGVSIGNGYELLGTGTETGYAILQSLITNSQGTISAADSLYSELAIWQDQNSDGVAQSLEAERLCRMCAPLMVAPRRFAPISRI